LTVEKYRPESQGDAMQLAFLSMCPEKLAMENLSDIFTYRSERKLNKISWALAAPTHHP
jgi:hypothetical protein